MHTQIKSRRWRDALALTPIALILVLGCADGASNAGPNSAGADFVSANKPTILIDQCSSSVGSGVCIWQSQDLTSDNAAYAEGDVVPFRASIQGLQVGGFSQVTIVYDFTEDGFEAYDFLATYNATETVDICGPGGKARSAYCDGSMSSTTFPIPTDGFAVADADDLNVSGAQIAGLFTMAGGNITSVSSYTHEGPTDRTSTARITLTFTANSSNVILAWGGHLASSSYWMEGEAPDGAGQATDGPWTMGLTGFSDVTTGGKLQKRSDAFLRIEPGALAD